MDYAKWVEHVQDALYDRVHDTEDFANVDERGLPGVYCDVIKDELHDDVRLTTIDEMIAIDMRGGNLGHCYYSKMREELEECGIDTTSWSNGYTCERYRLLMARTILGFMCESECVVRGYGAYNSKQLTINYD